MNSISIRSRGAARGGSVNSPVTTTGNGRNDFHMKTKSLIHHLVSCGVLLGAGLATTTLSAADASGSGPWRLSKATGLPDWLDISGTQRTRYETLDGQFRVGRPGGDQMLAFRTTLRLEAKTEQFSVVGEMMDSRQELADTGSPIDTTMINAAELLQGYAALRFEGPFRNDSRSEFRFGRQTIDIGSRRLVARNDFRNTINAFTGLHYEWQLKDGPAVRALYTLPITRLPSDAPSLLDNDIQFDEESFDLQFWGLHAQWPKLLWGATGEAYVSGLHESDSTDVPTRNRQLYTPGLRLARKPARGKWDFDLEGVAQFGTMRNSIAATDRRDLDHFAYFGHAEAGYTFDAAGSPRVALLYDHASGDDDPADGDSNRFDTLYGARRFEHGPTGIYGAFARANMQSPGLRFTTKPLKPVELMTTYRPYWLASDTDAWTTGGLRDPAGSSGSFVGHQLEARLRWDLQPGAVRLEAGGAYLFAGEFIKSAPNATGRDDTAYGYLSLEIAF